jgi:O-acetyl-ADP-ribose deacetylase
MMAAIVDQILLNNNRKRIIRLVGGDITERAVDVIVNAANSYLKHGGGGVAAAIVRKGEKIIQEESSKTGNVQVSSSVITTIAGGLLCKAVIHMVGPNMGRLI